MSLSDMRHLRRSADRRERARRLRTAGLLAGILSFALSGPACDSQDFVIGISKRPRVPTDGSISDAGTGGATGTGGADGLCDAPRLVFANNQRYGCASSVACHGQGSPYIDFSTDPFAALVGVPSKSEQSSCAGQSLVDQQDRTRGVFYERIQGTACGPVMPPVIGPVAPEDIACVKAWLTNGMR